MSLAELSQDHRYASSPRIGFERWLMLEPQTAVAASIAVGLAFGVGSGLWTPRGPITTVEALVTMTAATIVGFWAGLIQRSRWMFIALPLAYALAVEFTRIGVAGPTVDAPQPTLYGVIAFLSGRGVHGLLVFLPMVFGTAAGIAWGRRSMGLRTGATTERSLTVVAGIAALALAVGVARPAATDPISGDGVDGPSVAELTEVEVGDHAVSLMIRGASTENPVLLFLAGGPGGSELGAMRRHLELLEDHFVVVTLDQRGAGKSYDQLDPTSTMTLQAAIDDAIDVTRYLQERFGQHRIYLVGQSWGTILGTLAIEQHPELFEAYVGAGQMVSPAATDQIMYRDTLRWAFENGNFDLATTLRDRGMPPYENILFYEAIADAEKYVYAYDHTPNSEGIGGYSENLFVQEYTLLEQLHSMGSMMDTYSVLYPRIQHVDFRTDVRSLEIPVYFVQGAHEAAARSDVFEEWFDLLDAPEKAVTVLSTSGHRPLFEQPDEFSEFMVGIVAGG